MIPFPFRGGTIKWWWLVVSGLLVFGMVWLFWEVLFFWFGFVFGYWFVDVIFIVAIKYFAGLDDILVENSGSLAQSWNAINMGMLLSLIFSLISEYISIGMGVKFWLRMKNRGRCLYVPFQLPCCHKPILLPADGWWQKCPVAFVYLFPLSAYQSVFCFWMAATRVVASSMNCGRKTSVFWAKSEP